MMKQTLSNFNEQKFQLTSNRKTAESYYEEINNSTKKTTRSSGKITINYYDRSKVVQCDGQGLSVATLRKKIGAVQSAVARVGSMELYSDERVFPGETIRFGY